MQRFIRLLHVKREIFRRSRMKGILQMLIMQLLIPMDFRIIQIIQMPLERDIRIIVLKI